MKFLETLGRSSLSGKETLSGPGIEWWQTRAGPVRILRGEAASGPRLLFAADGPNVIEQYAPLLAQLRGRADTIVYEPPGTGGSLPASDFGFRLQDFAANAREVLEQSGPRVLVFPCYMSFVAGALTRESCPQVLGAVLPQGPSWQQMHVWMDRVDPRRVLRTPILGQALLRMMPRRVARGWYAGSAGPDARDALAAIAESTLGRGGCFCLASITQYFQSGAAQLDDLGEVPTAVAWGDLDRSHGLPDTVSFPRVGCVEHFPHCGHSPELEAPERFAAWLLDWCDEQGLSEKGSSSSADETGVDQTEFGLGENLSIPR
jgi:pimeloyl-ACP methyl ester carboxylesterase